MDVNAEKAIARLWGQVHEDLHETCRQLRSYLESTCNSLKFEGAASPALDFRYRTVDEPRIKPFPSVLRRIPDAQDPESLWQISDLVGARVVVVSPSDVPILVDRICRDADDGRLPMDDVQPDPKDEDSGYRAMHIKGRYHIRAGGTVGCEIQIRTALLDLWAVLSRHDLYLRDDLPDHLSMRARDQARYLVAADQILQDIRNEAFKIPPPKVEPGPRIDEPQVPNEEHK